MDFKLQDQLRELGIMEQEAEAQALIGEQVLQSIDGLNSARQEMGKNIKDIRTGLREDIRSMGDKLKK